MNYSAYSFVALSRLRQSKPGPQQKEDAAVPLSNTVKLAGSARISGISSRAPWYVRLFHRLLRRPMPARDRFEFELILKLDQKHSTDANTGLFDLRSQLGLAPDVKSAVIEVFIVPDAEN
jgi:hypothetical protein